MVPAPFEYVRASSLDEALSMLRDHDDAKLIAGGHSLLPMMKLRLAQPAKLIDIGRLEELRGISVDGDTVRVGSLTTHREIADSDELEKSLPILREAAAEIGDAQVRNRGTIGGNVAHADPASDYPAVLCAVGATVHLRGGSGERTVAAGDFFVDLLTTDLGPDEVITAITCPRAGDGVGSCYLKFEHPASGYAVVGAAAWVHLDGDGNCADAGLSFNGVAAKPVDGSAVVDALRGGPIDEGTLGEAAAKLQIDDPLGDIYASGDYRVHLARVYARRALAKAAERAG